MSRDNRFLSDTEDIGLFRSPSLNGLRPFYAGDFVEHRMNTIREYIVYIRHHWHERHKFASKLRDMMAERGTLDTRIRDCLSRPTDWAKVCTLVNEGLDYEILQIYTSERGYNHVFRVINSIFRRDDAVLEEDRVLCAVFLVELINVALFNYIMKKPERGNFQGILYRGMSVNADEFKAFEKLRKEPIPNRYISVPLSLLSTSYEYEVARKFIAKTVAEKAENDDESQAKALLMKIHVVGLPEEYLNIYRRRFPTSVISTICAVQIDELSEYPSEREVLLRGPFFQVLDLYKSEDGNWMTLEMMTLNTNRDHISTAFLGEKDGPARTLIGAMIKMERYRFAVEFYRKRNMTADEEEYRQEFVKAKAILDELVVM